MPGWTHHDYIQPWDGKYDGQDPRDADALYRIAEQYYRMTHDAIRRYDPNHLIIGDQLEHGKPLPDWLIEACQSKTPAEPASPCGEIIGEGFNRPIASHDPTAHAEIQAIRAAGLHQRNYRLPGTTLYVTLEPCTMCAAAISFARIRRLYFGASDPKAGGVEHGAAFFSRETCHHAPDVYGGIAGDEAGELLKRFFALRRGH